MLQKKRISSVILLSVILPIVLLAPFHHHEQPGKADISCDACSQHLPHQGHLSTGSGTDDCLICQLLGQQYFPSEGVTVLYAAAVSRPDTGFVSADIASVVFNLSSPRAPPVSFCS